jgi:hypothetical protein
MTQTAVQTQGNNKPQMMTIPQLAAQGYLPGRAIRRLVAEKAIPTVIPLRLETDNTLTLLCLSGIYQADR